MMFFLLGVDKKFLCLECFFFLLVNKDIDEFFFFYFIIINDEVILLFFLVLILSCFRKLRVRNFLFEMVLCSVFRLFSWY